MTASLTLNGNGGNDALVGDDGIDQLFGGDGDDVLADLSPDADFFIGGSNDTTTPPPPPPPGSSGAWGDVCADGDGYGGAPDYPDGTGNTGSISALQNDSLDGCVYVAI